MSSSPNLSSKEQEEIVHAINIHGIFFERWCLQTISKLANWRVTQFRYPVEYPAYKGEKTELDIQAELVRDNIRLVLCIECKKNNPDFTNWVFFNAPEILNLNPIRAFRAFTDPHEPKAGLVPLNFNMPLVDDCRETKSPYQPKANAQQNSQTKTKTANDSIQGAAKQIILSTQNTILTLLNEAYSRYINNRLSPSSQALRTEIVLPIVVTTARIYTCEFDPNEIDSLTGEIPNNRAALTQHPYVAFTNQLLPRLDIKSNFSYPGVLDSYYRLDLIIVNSNSLERLLGGLDSSLNSLVDQSG